MLSNTVFRSKYIFPVFLLLEIKQWKVESEKSKIKNKKIEDDYRKLTNENSEVKTNLTAIKLGST